MSEEGTWDELEEIFGNEIKERKTVIVSRGEKDFHFVIKRLTAKEQDMCDAKMRMVGRKKSPDVEIPCDLGAYKREIIRHGVVEGPKGKTKFNPKNERHLEKLFPEWINELAHAIETFSELPEVVRLSFRPSGIHGEGESEGIPEGA